MIHPEASVDECMEEISALEREIERLTELQAVTAARAELTQIINEQLELEVAAWTQASDLKADKIVQLQVLLNEARGPDGHTHERVAEWLREQGYTVIKNEPELWDFGEIPL